MIVEYMEQQEKKAKEAAQNGGTSGENQNGADTGSDTSD